MIRSVALPVLAATTLGAATSTPVTFHKDVLPILQKSCQECHRPGEAAPMAFLTYEQVRPWAKAIRQAVLTRKMPPWPADPHFGKFVNDRSLTASEIDKLVAWADGGARPGKAKDAPAARAFVDGWNIGRPETVIEMPNEFAVPATGTIEYQYIVLPTGFTEDKWIRMAEVRPGNRAVVHHVIAFVREPGSQWMKDAKPGVPYVPPRATRNRQSSQNNAEARTSEQSNARTELLVGYAPGLQHEVLNPGQAKMVKAGSDIVFQLHYTSNGKAATDKTKIGLVFASAPPSERVVTMAASNSRFVIPPGADNHKVESQITLKEAAHLTGLMPHMHLRGKAFEYRAVYPTGETQTLLKVPKYSFNWQLFYYLDKPLLLPKGTRIECTAHFDNSANNPDNPDAKAEVRWGDQSWEEMMIGWFDVAIDAKMDPARLTREAKPASSSE